jgi:Protein kinase domain/Tetratricopeptide repeat
MSSPESARGRCPTETELTEFAQGRSVGDARARTETHVATCAACRTRVSGLARVSGETAFAVTAPAFSPRPSVSQLSTGEVIGRYRIVRELGSGAMGTVYAAHDPDIDRPVALKLIRVDSDDPERRARVLREAKAIARVTHPDVITVHDVGTHGEAIFIAMELVEGGTLTEWLAMKDRTPQEILQVFLRAGRALAKAHEVGLVHRDFKPDNVLVGRDGRVRVTDFGLAREVRTDPVASRRLDDGVPESALGAELTIEGTIVGTPAYMAPEQLHGEPATRRSDIFSFSVALWEALHGTRPYAGTSLLALDISIREGRLLPETSPPGLQSLRRVLLPGLAADPAARYRTMELLIAELEKAVRPASRAARLLPRLIALGALLVVILGSVVAVRLSSKPVSIDKHAMIAILAPTASGEAADTAWVGIAIAEVAWADLALDGKVRTLSPDDVARMRRELAVTDADMGDSKTLRRIHDLMGVDFVLTGAWALEEGATRRVGVDLRLVRTKDAKRMASADAFGDAEDLAAVTLEAVDTLRRRAGIAGSKAVDTTTLKASLAQDSTSMQLYARGLERLRALDARAARELFTQAAARDPKSARVHAALARSLSALGRQEAAKAEAKQALELASTLPRNETLAIEALLRALSNEWDAAIEIARALTTFYPDDLDYAIQLADLQVQAGHVDDAQRTVASMRALPSPTSEDPRVDIAEMGVEAARSNFGRVLELADVAASKAEASGARGILARVRNQQFRAERETGKIEQALAHGREAAALYASVGDRAAEADVTSVVATIYADQGDLDAAERAMKASRDVYAELGADALAAGKNADLAIILRRRDDLAGARALGEKLLAEADGAGLIPSTRALIEHNLAIVYFDQGELGLARTHAESALGTRRAVKNRRGEASSLDLLADVLAAQGDLEGADRAARDAKSIASQISQRSLAAEADAGRAAFALARGRATDAVMLLDPACDLMHEVGSLIREAPCRATLARALALAGRGKDAIDQADRAMAMLDKGFAHAISRRAVRTDAALARALVDPSSRKAAIVELGKVAEEAGAVGAANGRLTAELALGLAMVAAERSAYGRAQLDQVASEAQRAGFLGIAAQARRGLSP